MKRTAAHHAEICVEQQNIASHSPRNSHVLRPTDWLQPLASHRTKAKGASVILVIFTAIKCADSLAFSELLGGRGLRYLKSIYRTFGGKKKSSPRLDQHRRHADIKHKQH